MYSHEVIWRCELMNYFKFYGVLCSQTDHVEGSDRQAVAAHLPPQAPRDYRSVHVEGQLDDGFEIFDVDKIWGCSSQFLSPA